MGKLSIIAPKDGDPRTPPEKIGEIDADGFDHDGHGHASLGPRAHRELIALLGNGYGDRQFHVVSGEKMLVNCSIVSQSAGCTLDFIRVEPAPQE